MKRQYLSPLVRLMVHRRDYWKCNHCGKTNKQAKLQVDHINPIALGGKCTWNNLQTLCSTCNLSKGARFIG